MTQQTKESSLVMKLIPVMLAFFAMSFVDSVGTATNYVKESFNLSNTVANLCPSMVFFWFLVCSVPTGMLMNKIGRRKTVLISLAVTLLALVLPLVYYHFATMMLAFALLGIGNAIMVCQSHRLFYRAHFGGLVCGQIQQLGADVCGVCGGGADCADYAGPRRHQRRRSIRQNYRF